MIGAPDAVVDVDVVDVNVNYDAAASSMKSRGERKEESSLLRPIKLVVAATA